MSNNNSLVIFRALVSKTGKKARKDENNVLSESVEAILKVNLPSEIRQDIISRSAIQSPEIRDRELKIFLSKESKKVDGTPLNQLFGNLYQERLYTEDFEDINEKADKFSKKELNIKIKIGDLLPKVLKIAVNDWKKLGRSHCLTIVGIKKDNSFIPLMYLLINGEIKNLDEVTIHFKEQSVPCEGISIRELLFFNKNKSWFEIGNSTINNIRANDDRLKIEHSIKNVDNRFVNHFSEAGSFAINSISFSDEVMDDMEYPNETYPRYLIPLLEKNTSLYSCLVFFLVSKVMSKDAYNIDISSLGYSLKTEFINYLKELL